MDDSRFGSSGLPPQKPWLHRLAAQFRLNMSHLNLHTDIPPELTERLFLDRAKDFSYVISAISLVGLTTLGLIFLDYFSTLGKAPRNATISALASIYCLIIWQGWQWLRRQDASGRDAALYFRRVSALLIGLGAFWGLLLILLLEYGSLNQRALVYAIAVGCIATPVLVSPTLCAIAFWAPISAGAMLSLFLYDRDIYAVADLASFVTLTGFCILYLNRRMNERTIGAIRLEENAELIRLLLRDFEENASDWLWETNARLEMQHVSRRLAQVAHRTPENFRGKFPQALLGEAAHGPALPGSALERLQRAIAERSPFRDLIIPVTIEGEQRFWSLTGKPILDKHGNFTGYHGVGSDITGQRRQQEHIAFLARHDSLTRLANRMLFSEILHQCCETAETEGFALLCLDLDNFKAINDTLGHATGDGVLVAVAERLRGCIREFDLVARLGGDEFAVIAITSSSKEALVIAHRIIERISRPFQFDGQLLQIGVSVGIAMAPDDGQTPTQLMKQADLALYRAKDKGRGTVQLYDQEIDDAMQARHSIQAGLRLALAREEIWVAFQPIVDLETGRIVGAEALARWTHPTLGIISPAEFIPMAEEIGIIGEIGAFVLRQACTEAASWPPDITIAVNLSPLQSGASQILPTITGILEETGLPAGRLELEIVESTLLETGSQIEKTLWELHKLGVRIALDDFGTGYSSLSYLRRFPFGKLKIDSSFVHDLGREDVDSSIILAIIGLAERMNMVVTAEGVENADQAETLRSYGCPQAQGFLFYRPMPAAAISGLVAEQTKKIEQNIH